MLRSGRTDDAVRLLGQAHDLNEANHLADPENAGFKRALGHALYYLGVARDEAAQPNDALVLVERSRVLRQEMVQASPDSANKVNLMLSLGRLGNKEAALPLVEELGATPTKNPDLRIDLARTLAQLSKAVTEGDQRTQLVDRGIAWLERAVEDGLSDPYALTSEVDLKPLRDHPKMAQLVEQLRTGMQGPEVAK